MKKMTTIRVPKICSSIKKKSFSSKGILELCEHEKNEANPNDGQKISFVSSGSSTKRLKDGMAGLFTIEANQSILALIKSCEIQYPNVKKEIENIISFI